MLTKRCIKTTKKDAGHFQIDTASQWENLFHVDQIMFQALYPTRAETSYDIHDNKSAMSFRIRYLGLVLLASYIYISKFSKISQYSMKTAFLSYVDIIFHLRLYNINYEELL